MSVSCGPSSAGSVSAGPVLSALERKRADAIAHLLTLRGGMAIEHSAEPMEFAMSMKAREHTAKEIDMAVTGLAMINGALARWRLGAYGFCVECGEPISAKRLAAVPEAARCLTCATAEVTR